MIGKLYYIFAMYINAVFYGIIFTPGVSTVFIDILADCSVQYVSKHPFPGVLNVPKSSGIKQVAQNKKAYHEYFILEKFEAGIELFGTEVKSIRQGNVNLKDSFCSIKDGELFARGMHVSPYEKGNIFNRDPMRAKRLLMHKREIMRLYGRIKQEGLTLIPLSVYFKDSRVKLELGLAKGKKLHDKRDVAAKKSSDREMDRQIKERNV